MRTASPALGRGVVLTVGLIVLGVALRRPDLAALSAPFAIAAVLMGACEVHRAPTVSAALEADEVSEGERPSVTLTVASDVDLDAVVVTIASRSLATAASPLTRVIAVRGGAAATVTAAFSADHWGRHLVGPFTIEGRGAGLLRVAPLAALPAMALTVLPAADPFSASMIVPHALAFAGEHRAASLGPGVEFAGIHPFTPGDRLRKINWRATLRARELHITSTFTERAAQVLVVIDALHDAGAHPESVLDVSVRAAAAISGHYLDHGDFVALAEYGARERLLMPGAGRRHLHRVRQWLVDTHAPQADHEGFADPWLEGRQVSRALVLVLSPLLDEHAFAQLAALSARGASVLALDTLPQSVQPETHDEIERLALRLWALEREMLIARLVELGVPVVAWAGTGSLDAVLHELARLAAAPRLVMR